MHPPTRLALNKEGVYVVRWTDRDSRGQSHGYEVVTGTRDPGQAQAFRAQWLKGRSEALAALTTPTVGQIIDKYLVDCRRQGVRDSQRYTIAPVQRELGAYAPQDLSGEPLGEYRALRSRDVADSTLRRELGALIAALNWAAHPDKGGLIDKALVPQILLPSEPFEPRRFLIEDQEEEFYALAQRWRLERIGLYVGIGLNTGARKEALQDLTWERIDLRGRLIDFRVPGRRPTKKRRVPVPINDRLLPVLEQVPEARRFGRVILDGDIRKAFATFVQSTPWPWVTSHIMRHTYITLLLRAGVSIFEVAQLVGDTAEIISKHYGQHASDSRLHAAANKRFR